MKEMQVHIVKEKRRRREGKGRKRREGEKREEGEMRGERKAKGEGAEILCPIWEPSQWQPEKIHLRMNSSEGSDCYHFLSVFTY